MLRSVQTEQAVPRVPAVLPEQAEQALYNLPQELWSAAVSQAVPVQAEEQLQEQAVSG